MGEGGNGVDWVSDPKLFKDFSQAADVMWLCFCGAGVFFMQAGFSMLEVGSVRVKNTRVILLKNTLDNCVTGVWWFICGYAFAFGRPEHPDHDWSTNPISGYHNFALEGSKEYAFFFYEYCFAASAATIVSGAIAERATLIAYLLEVSSMSLCIYPFIAHWAWGDGWLANFRTNGYLDYAGSGVVHLTGGSSALVGAIILGPRVGRFGADGKVQKINGYSTTLICLGAFVLWFGWYGFNVGSILQVVGDHKITVGGRVAVNTTLSGASGGLTALLATFLITKSWDILNMVNGLLAGLVSITAGCAFVPNWAAVAIGASSALWYMLLSWVYIKLKIDDPVDAGPVHAGCGSFGVIMVGLFASQEAIEQALGHKTDQWGLFLGGGGEQLYVQVVGALAIFGWSATISIIVYGLLRLAGLLRVKEADEIGHKQTSDAWARIQVMDMGRLEEFQFKMASK